MGIIITVFVHLLGRKKIIKVSKAPEKFVTDHSSLDLSLTFFYLKFRLSYHVSDKFI